MVQERSTSSWRPRIPTPKRLPSPFHPAAQQLLRLEFSNSLRVSAEPRIPRSLGLQPPEQFQYWQVSAPAVTTNTSVTITATSTADGSVRGTAALVVTAPAQLAIAKSVLPEANTGMAYTASLFASGGTSPYQWALSAGTLPSGIQLQPSTGVISGMTSLSGSFAFTAKVTDSAGSSSTQSFTLPVSSSSATGFDGPAELPRIYIQSAIANTPASGTTITVKSGGDLQSALNSANCGDTIALQAGATFSGTFTFPAKSCDDNHWVIVRTNASDSALPAEGSRLTPCYAGVSSLPGRPALQCTSTKKSSPN